MKKLLMLFAAVFAISATSFAQVEAPAKTATPSVKMENKRVKGAHTKRHAHKMGASKHENRTEKIVARMNENLIAKNPKLALSVTQSAQLIEIHDKRQAINSSLPKLETAEDKTAFREARKAASKEFKESLATILTPEQNEAYIASKREKKAKRALKKGKKPMKAPPVKSKTIEKN